MNKKRSIRVVLVDDHQNIHDIVSAVLREHDDIKLVGQVYNGEDALLLCQTKDPDLVLMDVVMPGIDGAQTTKTILTKMPHIKILVLSSFSEYENIKAVIENGAIGYLVKDALVDELSDTIRSAARGNMVLSPKVLQTILSPPVDHPINFNLTDRELEVLQHIGQGMNNGQVAVALKIKIPTVRFHLSNILNKMEVNTRSEALVLAAKNDLI